MSDDRIFQTISRIEKHEAMCEERSRTIFNRLENIENGLDRINRTIFQGAVVLICGLASVIVSLLFLLQ